MASIDFMKLHAAQEVRNVLKHCDKDKRQQNNHSNKNIDKSLTYQNLQKIDYDTAYNHYKDKIAELDNVPGANKRKDRVTAFGLEAPVPLGFDTLSPDRQIAWYQMALNEIVSFSGGRDNLLGWYIHKDEVHEYIHHETGEKTMSREHLHVFVVPDINGKLNGKQFSCKQRMREINNIIHERTLNEFGLMYQTGGKKHSKQAVEELKRLSELRKQESALQDAVNTLHVEFNTIHEKNRKLREENERLQREQVNIYFDRFRNKAVNNVSDDIANSVRRSVRTIPERLKKHSEREIIDINTIRDGSSERSFEL